MKISELMAGLEQPSTKHNKYSILDGFSIWMSNEEAELLERLKNPTKLSNLSEHDQVRVQGLIRKSLVSKIGLQDPTIVANEKPKTQN
jgi:hypothetical protein